MVFKNILRIANKMQIIRDHFGKPIWVNSGYRSPAYNASINGAPKSKHKLGQACDFTVEGLTPNEVADELEILMKEGAITNGGLGRYDTFTHYDIRRTKARWDNRTV
jgi:uncharacterized protein YcbK (DUF882 family)